jgi:hypothetical protein
LAQQNDISVSSAWTAANLLRIRPCIIKVVREIFGFFMQDCASQNTATETLRALRGVLGELNVGDRIIIKDP